MRCVARCVVSDFTLGRANKFSQACDLAIPRSLRDQQGFLERTPMQWLTRVYAASGPLFAVSSSPPDQLIHPPLGCERRRDFTPAPARLPRSRPHREGISGQISRLQYSSAARPRIVTLAHRSIFPGHHAVAFLVDANPFGSSDLARSNTCQPVFWRRRWEEARVKCRRVAFVPQRQRHLSTFNS